MRRQGRRQVGFSLVELMIALGLSSIVAAGLLALTRSQLVAFRNNEQLSRAQQNARAGMGYIENLMRRSCAGISSGIVYVNVPGLTTFTDQCVHHYDGVSSLTTPAGRFTGGSPGTKADAVEIVYGYGNMTGGTAFNTGTLVATVSDTTGFTVGDLILVSDKDMKEGALFKLSAKSAPTGAGTLSFGTPGGGTVNIGSITTTDFRVLRGKSVALYVNDTAGDPLQGSLMLDPDGMAGTVHTDAEPLIDNVDDFQIALGLDTNADGVVTDAGNSTDEWLGNHTSDVAIAAPTVAAPWNGTGPKPRQIRVGLLVRTAQLFRGDATTLTALGNRTITPATGAGQNPRWRPLRMAVAPRGWNLNE